MKRIFIFIFIVLFVAFLGLSLGFSEMKMAPGVDKIYHFGAFFIATIAISGACYYAFSSKQWFNYFLITVCIVGGLVGAAIEKLQDYYCVNRTSEYEDWLANIVGITIGIIIIYLFKTYKERRKEQNDDYR